MTERVEMEQILNEEDTNDIEDITQPKNLFVHEKTQSKQNPKKEKCLDEKITRTYEELGTVLRIYRDGPLPKAILILTEKQFKNWLDFLELTEPIHWSCQAVYAITQHFSKEATDIRMTTYNREVLLSIMLDYVNRGESGVPTKTWDACVLSANRPLPFVKGFLIPLSEEDQISPKLAAFISTIATKIRLPPVHVNAFLIHICESSQPTPVKSVFISRFISNGKVMTIHAIDDIVAYFLAFQTIDEKQPLIWFKGLLDFVKRYGQHMTFEQRDAIDHLIEKQFHKTISNQVRIALKKLPAPRPSNVHPNTEIEPMQHE